MMIIKFSVNHIYLVCLPWIKFLFHNYQLLTYSYYYHRFNSKFVEVIVMDKL